MRVLTTSSALFLCFSAFCLLTSTASAKEMSCRAVSSIWSDVGAKGYRFSVYSNHAFVKDRSSYSWGQSCLQWIAKNKEDKSAVKIDWYYPISSTDAVPLLRGTLTGCHDIVNKPCDCKLIPCQLYRETSPEIGPSNSKPTTVDFGLYLRGPSHSSAQLTEGHVPALVPNVRKDGSSDTSDNNQSARPSQGSISIPVVPVAKGWKYPMIVTRVGGYPEARGGAVIPLDVRLISVAKKETKERYYFIHRILSSRKGAQVYVASSQAMQSGQLDIPAGSIAIAWTALEVEYGKELFDKQHLSFRLGELSKRFVPYSAARAGISQLSKVMVYYDGEIILETLAPAYLPLDKAVEKGK